MIGWLAQESGPIQARFGPGENLALWLIFGVSLVALLFAWYLVREVLAAPEGTDKMKEIARAIQKGAAAYLNRQFRTVGVFIGILFVLPARFLADVDLPPLLRPAVALPVLLISTACFGTAFWLAILRYRLWDIDIVVRRTVVYGAVSATLVATYFGTVILLHALLRPFTSGSDLAVAGSTLLVVALFQPVRSRIRDAVDRRFYRSRYDAVRTLDAFGARLRDDVDLDSVRADLIDVVNDTIRPAHAGVWLRERTAPVDRSAAS